MQMIGFKATCFEYQSHLTTNYQNQQITKVNGQDEYSSATRARSCPCTWVPSGYVFTTMTSRLASIIRIGLQTDAG